MLETICETSVEVTKQIMNGRFDGILFGETERKEGMGHVVKILNWVDLYCDEYNRYGLVVLGLQKGIRVGSRYKGTLPRKTSRVA